MDFSGDASNNKDNRSLLKETYDELQKSFGYLLRNKLNEIHLSKSVLDLNFVELANFIKEYEATEEIITDGEKDREMRTELVRLLQNYVASVYSYNEHVDKTLKKIEYGLCKAYEKERKKIREDENVAFVRDLRRYSQHFELIPQSTSVSFVRINDSKPIFESSISVELLKDSLEKWDGWRGKSKDFIINMDESIKLIIPLAKQLRKLNELHNWVLDEIFSRYKEQIAELNDLIEEILTLQERIKEENIGRKEISWTFKKPR